MNVLVLRVVTVREGGGGGDKIQFQCFILYITIPEPVKSLPDDVGSDGKERGELQPPLTFVEQSQTEIFEEDPEVENEAASKEADGNEPIEHAASSIGKLHFCREARKTKWV